MKTLTVIKPVSIKLQKKSNDIVKAYNMIAETEKELRQMRNNVDTVFKAWCASAIDLGSDLQRRYRAEHLKNGLETATQREHPP